MAQQLELAINKREVMGKATKRLRKVGILPANIYGHKEAPQAIQVDATEFDRLRRSHGATGIVTLRMLDSADIQTALIRHVQHNPRSGKIIHVDFFRVSMNESVTVKVQLHFVGESSAVEDEGGVLLHLLETLEVECLARNIPEYIEVDITPLTEIDTMIHAGDIQLPADIKLLTDPHEGVAKVGATRAEVAEEVAGAEAAGEAAPAEGAGVPSEAGSEA